MREVHRQHKVVGDAFVAFVLEMVLGEPQGVVAQRVHLLRDRFSLLKDGGQMLVRIAPLVGGSGFLPAVGKIDVAGIHRRELRDHTSSLRMVLRVAVTLSQFRVLCYQTSRELRGSIEWTTSRSAAPGSGSASPGSAAAGGAGSGTAAAKSWGAAAAAVYPR